MYTAEGLTRSVREELSKQVLAEARGDTDGTSHRGIYKAVPEGIAFWNNGHRVIRTCSGSGDAVDENYYINRMSGNGDIATIRLNNGTEFQEYWGDETHDMLGQGYFAAMKEVYFEEQLVNESGEALPDETQSLDSEGNAVFHTTVEGSVFQFFGDLPEGTPITLDPDGKTIRIHVDAQGEHRPAQSFQVTEQYTDPESGTTRYSRPRTLQTNEVLLDTIGPEIQDGSLSPQGLRPENGTSFDLEMAFDEEVFVGTGKIILSGIDLGADGQGTDVHTFEFDASDLIIEATSLRLPVSVHRFARYSVHMDEGILQDEWGNKFKGISGDTWTFQTKDWKTGKEDMKNEKTFKIYPNSVVDNVTLENASELDRIEIIDMTGRMVSRVQHPTEQLSLGYLSQGRYVVRLIDTKGRQLPSVKILKE